MEFERRRRIGRVGNGTGRGGGRRGGGGGEPPPRKKKASSKNNYNDDSDSDVTSSEEEDTFFRPYQPKSQKIKAAAVSKTRMAVERKKEDASKRPVRQPQQRQETIDLTPSSSDEDEEDRKPAATKTKTLSSSSLLQQPHDSNDDNDSDAMADESVLYEPDGAVTSKYFAKSSASSSLIDSLVDLVDTPHQAGAIRKKPSASLAGGAAGDDLEDTPMEEDAIRKKPVNNKKKKKRRLESQYNSELVLGADDYCDNPDEAIALIAAQEESERQKKMLLPENKDDKFRNSSDDDEDDDEPDEDNRGRLVRRPGSPRGQQHSGNRRRTERANRPDPGGVVQYRRRRHDCGRRPVAEYRRDSVALVVDRVGRDAARNLAEYHTGRLPVDWRQLVGAVARYAVRGERRRWCRKEIHAGQWYSCG